MEHVVICGGGIAGTAAALALRTAGIAVTVVDTRPAGDSSGAVVRVNPNGMDALRALQVHQPIIGRSFPLVRTERVTPDGRRLGYKLAADPASERGLPRVLHWATLSRLLREEAIERGATFRHGNPVVDIQPETDGVVAVLEDSARVEGDILVGADGVHSRVRGRLHPHGAEPERLGTRTVYGYASNPSCEPPPVNVLRAYVGSKAFFAATRDSLSGGCFWFTSLPAPQPSGRGEPTDPERLRAEMLELYRDDTTIATDVIRSSERILTFDDYALSHVPRWYDDRMVLIGDALHVAPPASEQGAAIAIEDGVQLARCLRDHPRPTDAFAAFEQLRRDRVEAVVSMGKAGTSRAHRQGPSRWLRDRWDRTKQLFDWQRRPPTGGGWAYDHHIRWDASTADGAEPAERPSDETPSPD